jgi:hypothetical protein
MFAVVADDVACLKVDDADMPAFGGGATRFVEGLHRAASAPQALLRG